MPVEQGAETAGRLTDPGSAVELGNQKESIKKK